MVFTGNDYQSADRTTLPPSQADSTRAQRVRAAAHRAAATAAGAQPPRVPQPSRSGPRSGCGSPASAPLFDGLVHRDLRRVFSLGAERADGHEQPPKPILRYHYHICVTATTALRNLFGGKIPLVTGKCHTLPPCWVRPMSQEGIFMSTVRTLHLGMPFRDILNSYALLSSRVYLGFVHSVRARSSLRQIVTLFRIVPPIMPPLQHGVDLFPGRW